MSTKGIIIPWDIDDYEVSEDVDVDEVDLPDLCEEDPIRGTALFNRYGDNNY